MTSSASIFLACLVLIGSALLPDTASADEPLGRDPGRFLARIDPVEVVPLPEWPRNDEHPVRAIARQLDSTSREQRQDREGWSIGLSQTGLALVRRF